MFSVGISFGFWLVASICDRAVTDDFESHEATEHHEDQSLDLFKRDESEVQRDHGSRENVTLPRLCVDHCLAKDSA